jgi:hypothetical protein
MMGTTADVFIFETLGFADEVHGRQEGSFLAHVLKYGGRKHKYFYFRTIDELKAIARKFGKSGYRYLHISCHTDETGIKTTLGSITYAELGKILGPHLRGRRVFFSACGGANRQCADALMSETGCYSVMGPSEDVRFDDSAIVWASFYHRVFRLPDEDGANPVTALKRKNLVDTARGLSQFHQVPFKLFYRDSDGNIKAQTFSNRQQ